MKTILRFAFGVVVAASAALVFDRPRVAAEEAETGGDPPQVTLGERLFLETRFSQHFFATSGGNVNASVPGDPALAFTSTTGDASIAGPFAAGGMNCRACHLVDEHRDTPGGGVRAYADFARRSPIPDRGDGLSLTLRNSPSLVGAAGRRGATLLLHLDGEFATAEDLVVGTFTGRNFGWLPSERDAAIRHIARVIRRDDGKGALAQEFGGGYARIFKGTSRSIPAEFRLPRGLRIDVMKASDERVVRAAARLVAAYMRSLSFARDKRSFHSGSAYDVFLKKNGLPRAPRRGETTKAYGARLLGGLASARQYVDQRDGDLALHDQPFLFRQAELRGLRIFLTRAADAPEATSGVGNCVACHAPPEFTDFAFHATGVSQVEFDKAHGDGAFFELPIPSLATRNEDFDAFLPATPTHPNALGPFASIPSAEAAGRADLGVWNVFANPDQPRAQLKIRRMLVAQFGGELGDGALLDKAVASFKTPSLRDLDQSAPYFHDGSTDTFPEAVQLYVRVSDLARQGKLRNADPELAAIRLGDADVHDLAAFLASLDEDYE